MSYQSDTGWILRIFVLKRFDYPLRDYIKNDNLLRFVNFFNYNFIFRLFLVGNTSSLGHAQGK